MAAPTGRRLRLAVFASGSGRTLTNLVDAAARGELAGEVALVLASSAKAGVLERARAANVPTAVVPARGLSASELGERCFTACRDHDIDLVLLAGFLKQVTIPADFAGRVMNIHPSLIPAFCGHGFYGERVHRAVLERGCKVSGCTVHFADDDYDHGPIVLQRVVPVEEGDTPATLAARVFAAECQAYPDAVNLYAADRLRIDGPRVHVLPPRW